MTRNAAGEWRSVEFAMIRRSEKLIGAIYRNELAMRLQSLGMAVTSTLIDQVPGFELAGYDRSFLDAFEGRRREILAYLEKHDLPYNARNAEMAALRSQAAKREVGLSDLVGDGASGYARGRADAMRELREVLTAGGGKPAGEGAPGKTRGRKPASSDRRSGGRRAILPSQTNGSFTIAMASNCRASVRWRLGALSTLSRSAQPHGEIRQHHRTHGLLKHRGEARRSVPG